MPEETPDDLKSILDAGQQIKGVAETLFEKCPTCDDIVSYLRPQGTEETRLRTKTEIEAVMLDVFEKPSGCIEKPFDYLVSAGFIENVEGEIYKLSQTGLFISGYARNVPESLRI